MSPTCLHTAPAAGALWLPELSLPPLRSAAFILPQQQHREKKGGEGKGWERETKRKIWGWKSQLGIGIWKELTCCQAEMKALEIRDAHLLKWWHDSNKESTSLAPAGNGSHERATQQSRTAKFCAIFNFLSNMHKSFQRQQSQHKTVTEGILKSYFNWSTGQTDYQAWRDAKQWRET